MLYLVIYKYIYLKYSLPYIKTFNLILREFLIHWFCFNVLDLQELKKHLREFYIKETQIH